MKHHLHRIFLNGANNYKNPWYLPADKPQELDYLLLDEEYKEFQRVFNSYY